MKKFSIALASLVIIAGCEQPRDSTMGAESLKPSISAEEARAIAKESYIFHYPLVYYYRTMYRQAIDPPSDTYRGFGKWLHLGVSSPADQDIPSPNNDSP